VFVIHFFKVSIGHRRLKIFGNLEKATQLLLLPSSFSLFLNKLIQFNQLIKKCHQSEKEPMTVQKPGLN